MAWKSLAFVMATVMFDGKSMGEFSVYCCLLLHKIKSEGKAF